MGNSEKMKLSLIFIQLAAAFVTERRCIALKLKCSGGNSRFEYNSSCMGLSRPGNNWTMTINNATKGNTCDVRLVDGVHHVTSECQNEPSRRENGGLQWTTSFYSDDLSLSAALTCRQSPPNGPYMQWTESQTREYSWNPATSSLELENAFGIY